MPTHEETRALLLEPFPVELIEFRQGDRGAALVYVELWPYMNRLDEAAPGDWNAETEVTYSVATEGKNGKPGVLQVVTVRLTVAGSTQEANSDLKTPTSAYAQAFKRACAMHGLGRYLYNAPKLENVYSGYGDDARLTVHPSVLVEKCYKAWGLELPEDFEVIDDAPPARTSKSSGNSSQQSSRSESAPTSNNEKVGGFTSKQAYRLGQLGLSVDEIKAIPWKNSREVMDKVFADQIDGDGIREEYIQQAAPAQSSGRRQRW